MSSEKVQEFLKRKEKEKDIQEIKNRYNILSHYNLGENVYFEGEGNEDEYPLKDFDSYGKTRKFKYDCKISDEDFERVREIYNQEVGSSNMGTNDGAEKVLSTCAAILLIIGIIAFIVLWIAAADSYHFNWTMFGIGTGVLLTSLIEFAFAKVLVNISRKLNKLG